MSSCIRRSSVADERGFTLIEVLISIIILSFGLVAVSNLMVVAASSNIAGNHATAAASEASEAMEMLKAVPYSKLIAGGSLTGDLPATNATQNITDATGTLNQFNLYRPVAGVGTIRIRWQVTAVDTKTYFIDLIADSTSPIVASRSRAEFTTFRTCTVSAPPMNCP